MNSFVIEAGLTWWLVSNASSQKFIPHFWSWVSVVMMLPWVLTQFGLEVNRGETYFSPSLSSDLGPSLFLKAEKLSPLLLTHFFSALLPPMAPFSLGSYKIKRIFFPVRIRVPYSVFHFIWSHTKLIVGYTKWVFDFQNTKHIFHTVEMISFNVCSDTCF